MEIETAKVQAKIDLLADDVGRLRRGLDPGSSLRHAADRLAGNLESLDLMFGASAGELVAWYAPGDPEAVDAALEIIDARARVLRHRMRGPS